MSAKLNIGIGTLFIACLLSLSLLGCGSNGGGDSGSSISSGNENSTGSGKGILYVPNAGQNSILAFHNASTASGNIIPSRIISGVNTELNKPMDIVVDVTKDRMYVANRDGDNILVFDSASQATGNIAPARTISISNPISVALDTTRDILYVITAEVSFTGHYQGNAIAVFDQASNISGNVSPNRFIYGNNTQLKEATDLFIDTNKDRLYLSQVFGISSDVHMSVFNNASIANGNITPSRMLYSTLSIPSPTNAMGISLDLNRDIAYLATFDLIEVYEHASTVNGNLSPGREVGDQIDLPTNWLKAPSGIFIDSQGDRLYVATPPFTGSGGAIWILDHGSTISGDTAPYRLIAGPNTTLSFPALLQDPVGIFVDTTR